MQQTTACIIWFKRIYQLNLYNFMPTLSERLNAAVDQTEADAGKLQAIVNGPATGDASIVTTEGGPVKTAARKILEIEQAADDIYVARDDAIAAKNAAQAAASTAAADAVAAVQADLEDEVTAAETARTGAETARDEAVAAAASVIQGLYGSNSFASDDSARINTAQAAGEVRYVGGVFYIGTNLTLTGKHSFQGGFFFVKTGVTLMIDAEVEAPESAFLFGGEGNVRVKPQRLCTVNAAWFGAFGNSHLSPIPSATTAGSDIITQTNTNDRDTVNLVMGQRIALFGAGDIPNTPTGVGVVVNSAGAVNYAIRVSAVDSLGGVSVSSAAVNITGNAAPNNTISWTAPALVNASSIRLYIIFVNNVLVGNVPGTVTTFEHTSNAEDTTMTGGPGVGISLKPNAYNVGRGQYLFATVREIISDKVCRISKNVPVTRTGAEGVHDALSLYIDATEALRVALSHYDDTVTFRTVKITGSVMVFDTIKVYGLFAIEGTRPAWHPLSGVNQMAGDRHMFEYYPSGLGNAGANGGSFTNIGLYQRGYLSGDFYCFHVTATINTFVMNGVNTAKYSGGLLKVDADCNDWRLTDITFDGGGRVRFEGIISDLLISNCWIGGTTNIEFNGTSERVIIQNNTVLDSNRDPAAFNFNGTDVDDHQDILISGNNAGGLSGRRALANFAGCTDVKCFGNQIRGDGYGVIIGANSNRIEVDNNVFDTYWSPVTLSVVPRNFSFRNNTVKTYGARDFNNDHVIEHTFAGIRAAWQIFGNIIQDNHYKLSYYLPVENSQLEFNQYANTLKTGIVDFEILDMLTADMSLRTAFEINYDAVAHHPGVFYNSEVGTVLVQLTNAGWVCTKLNAASTGLALNFSIQNAGTGLATLVANSTLADSGFQFIFRSKISNTRFNSNSYTGTTVVNNGVCDLLDLVE